MEITLHRNQVIKLIQIGLREFNNGTPMRLYDPNTEIKDMHIRSVNGEFQLFDFELGEKEDA